MIITLRDTVTNRTVPTKQILGSNLMIFEESEERTHEKKSSRRRRKQELLG